MKHVLFFSLFLTAGSHCSYNAQPTPNQVLIGAFSHPHMRYGGNPNIVVQSPTNSAEGYVGWIVTDTTKEYLHRGIKAKEDAIIELNRKRSFKIALVKHQYDDSIKQWRKVSTILPPGDNYPSRAANKRDLEFKQINLEYDRLINNL
ncbi:MAG: hypothetical protein NTU89_02465 [Candidatus Dependentiae bacterium]|nr:hypothetical protein [Candidatus Dependentiae bacterium]